MSICNDANLSMPVVPAYGNCGNGNGNSMFGGDWAAWILLFVIFAAFGWGGMGGFGGGFGGFGGGINSPAGQGALTRGDLCQDMNFQDLQNGVRGIGDTLNAGFRNIDNAICTRGYQDAQLINGVERQIGNEFRGMDNAICTLGYQTQQGFNATQVAMMQGQTALQAQLANCCCENREAIAQVRYDMATESCATRNTIQNTTRDIIENQNANSRAILDALNQNYVRTLENENQSLKLAASQSNQNAVLMAAMDANKAELLRRTGHDCPTAAYVVQPPTPVNFPTNCCGTFNGGWGNGYGNGCGTCGNC